MPQPRILLDPSRSGRPRSPFSLPENMEARGGGVVPAMSRPSALPRSRARATRWFISQRRRDDIHPAAAAKAATSNVGADRGMDIGM